MDHPILHVTDAALDWFCCPDPDNHPIFLLYHSIDVGSISSSSGQSNSIWKLRCCAKTQEENSATEAEVFSVAACSVSG